MCYIGLVEKRLDVTKEILAGENLLNFLHLLVQNRFRISFPYIPRLLYSLLMGCIVGPFRVLERLRFDARIWETEVRHPPLFILGHWRSGTTYMHNLLSQDKQFGFVSTFHAFLPGAFIVGEGFFKSIVSSSLPKKRPMDDVDMGVDLPQEEEYAIGGFSPFSYYHGWCFPWNMEFYNRFVCFNGFPSSVIEKWKKFYLYLVKKETFFWGGRRLLLKNPANTGRIKLLLEMFPEAKFIHIQRNPYHLYYSMVRFMRTVIPLYCIQTPPPFKIVEELMLQLYVEIYRKYFEERVLIPAGNLVEVRYEDFIRDPLEEVRRVYTVLGLDGFEEAEDAFKSYIDSQRNVRLHEYRVSDDVREKLSSKWGFIIKEFGYDK